jgi:hypothetical protein
VSHPRRPNNRPETLDKVRQYCLSLPGSSEKQAWGGPTFRAGGKMFAMYMDDHHGDGRLALWCNADADARDLLVNADPKRFFVPPYMGPRGWLGVRLDKRLGWKRVTELLEGAYRRTATKRLCVELDAR